MDNVEEKGKGVKIIYQGTQCRFKILSQPLGEKKEEAKNDKKVGQVQRLKV